MGTGGKAVCLWWAPPISARKISLEMTDCRAAAWDGVAGERYIPPNPQGIHVRVPGLSVQLLGHVWLFVTPWTAARQASLSIANSQSLLKLMSIELVIPSKDLILCPSLLLLPSIFPASGSFLMSQFFPSGGQSIGVSASASVLPMNI